MTGELFLGGVKIFGDTGLKRNSRQSLLIPQQNLNSTLGLNCTELSFVTVFNPFRVIPFLEASLDE